jgi:hypothetical protein
VIEGALLLGGTVELIEGLIGALLLGGSKALVVL